MRQTATSKPEVISAIRTAARGLRRTPTRSEFQSMSGIHWTKVQRLFGGYRAAVREAGLEPDPGGIRIGTAAMLLVLSSPFSRLPGSCGTDTPVCAASLYAP